MLFNHPIVQTFVQNKLIYEPFYSNGQSGRYIREVCPALDLFHEPVDFFDQIHHLDPQSTVVVSNPPYSKKQEILKTLLDLDMPFCLLFPLNVIGRKFFIKLMEGKEEHLQILIPKQSIRFEQMNGQLIRSGPISFVGCWICYNPIQVSRFNPHSNLVYI